MLNVGFKSDTGMRRDNNEDSVFVLPRHKIYMLADGVGGNNSGEIASRMAVSFVAEYVDKYPVEQLETKEQLKKYFMECISSANDAVYQLSTGCEENAGMATTMALCYIAAETAYVVNVGDSRAYLIRNKKILQITTDHTYVNELLLMGSISEEEAKNHPERNRITRAIGWEPQVRPDFFQTKLFPGDILLLCTDGLFGELSDEEICSMATTRRSMYRLSNDLIQEANERGGKDNISVICIKI